MRPSLVLHLSVVRCVQVTKVELRRTYGYELVDIWWGASRVSGSGNLRLQEGSITLGQFLSSLNRVEQPTLDGSVGSIWFPRSICSAFTTSKS